MRRAIELGYTARTTGYASKCHLCADVRKFLVQRGLWHEWVGPPECYGLPLAP
jgi:hypothetical protein